jgi:hypothetical protein
MDRSPPTPTGRTIPVQTRTRAAVTVSLTAAALGVTTALATPALANTDRWSGYSFSTQAQCVIQENVVEVVTGSGSSALYCYRGSDAKVQSALPGADPNRWFLFYDSGQLSASAIDDAIATA